jgi:tetratricopeptide (TPR) repeat protein
MVVEGMHSSSAQSSGPIASFREFREQSEAERPFVPIMGGPRLFVLMLYASVVVVASLQYFAGERLWAGAWDIYNSYVFVVTGVFVFLGLILLFTGKRLPAEETKLPVSRTYLAILGLALLVIDGLVLVVLGESIGQLAVPASILLMIGFVLLVFASEVIPKDDSVMLAVFGAGLIIMVMIPVHEAFGLLANTQGDPFTLLNLALLVIGMVMAVYSVQSIKTRDAFIAAWLMGAMVIFLLAFHEQVGIVSSGNYSVFDRLLAVIGITFSFLPLAMYFWRERIYFYLWTKLKWANRLMETGDYEGSLKHTDAALKQCARVGIDDRFALPWSLKADVLYRMKEYPKARVHYETALQIDPKDSVSWSNVGNMNAFEGKQEAALKAYDEALKADPKNPTVWNNKGVVFQSMGMYQEAVICFDKALSYDPDFFDAHINMAKLESKLGHSNDALRHYQRAFDVRPDSPVARDGVAKEFYRGMCLDQINGWESLGLDTAPLKQILEQDPQHFLFRTKEYLRSIVDRKTPILTTPSKEHIDMDAAFQTILEMVEPPGATIEELKEYTGLKERDLVLPMALLSETDKIYFETLDDRQVYVKKGKLPERPRPPARVAPPRAATAPPMRDSGPPPSVYDTMRRAPKPAPRPPPEPEVKKAPPPPPEPKPEPIPAPRVEPKPPPPPAPKPEPDVEFVEFTPPPPPPAPKAEPEKEIEPEPVPPAPAPKPPPAPIAKKTEEPKPEEEPVVEVPVVTVACPGCGLSLGGDEKKCPRCDLPLESAALDCPICGEEFEFSAQSCSKCGAIFRRPTEPTALIKSRPEVPAKPTAKPAETEKARPAKTPPKVEPLPKKAEPKKPEPRPKKGKERAPEPAKQKEPVDKKPGKDSRSPEEELEEDLEEDEESSGLIERNVVTVEPTASMLVFTKVKPKAKQLEPEPVPKAKPKPAAKPARKPAPKAKTKTKK